MLSLRQTLVPVCCALTICLQVVSATAAELSAESKSAGGSGKELLLAIPEDSSVVEMIDSKIRETWEAYEIEPADIADDDTWCRRVYLDLIGRIPTMAEIAEFFRDKDEDKRLHLVEKLLYDDRYTAEFAEHWATVWSNLLVGRADDQDRRSLTNVDGMKKYLRDTFARGKSYDRMVYELITATGTTKPGTPDFNGATNFLVGKVNEEDGTLATSSTSRIFLGQQVQCTQCHNHPFNQWKQQRFWEFNAFFRQTRALRRFQEGMRDVDYAELVDEDFRGQNGDPSDAQIFFELRNGLSRAAYPIFTDENELTHPIDNSGFVEDVVRRERLADFVLKSENFDRMIVNRMWAQFLGYGFTKPMDDLGPHNPPTHPELMDGLGKQFRATGYDMRRLMVWITTSAPYQLSSQLSEDNRSDDPTMGETAKFSRFYLRQMSAEQLYSSMVVATSAKAEGDPASQEQQRRRWLQQFVVAFGNDEGTEATTFNGSIPQALMLFNGELTRKAVATDQGTFLDRIIESSGGNPKKCVTQLFYAGLSRRPSKSELSMASTLFRNSGGKPEQALGDLWWAILNSNEFIMQH
ncbi:MAG: DUF1549 domain-containing protein [Planctomycetota bacterium]